MPSKSCRSTSAITVPQGLWGQLPQLRRHALTIYDCTRRTSSTVLRNRDCDPMGMTAKTSVAKGMPAESLDVRRR